MKYKLLFITALFCTSTNMLWAQLQNMLEPSIRTNALNVSENVNPALQNTKIEKFDNENYFITKKITLQSFTQPQVSIEELSTEINNSLKYDTSLKPLNTFTPKVFIGLEKKIPIAYILIPKFIIEGNNKVVLKTHKLTIQEMPASPIAKRGARLYANNSVLSTGKFYKIGVKSNGLFKIDFSFIKDKMGLDPATINTNNIRLYGNGGNMLYEDNNVLPNDDLVENAIQVIDGGDGKFDNGDYILFYATGPTEIVKDSFNKRFLQRLNLYSDESFYFLNFDKGAGKRIAITNLNPTPNTTVNSYNHFAYHEVDLYNIGKFGKRWLGELFQDNTTGGLSRTFDFDVTDIVPSEPIIINSAKAALSVDAPSQFQTFANNVLLNTSYLSKVSSGSYNIISYASEATSTTTSSNSLQLKFNFSSTDAFAKGYLDYVNINCRRNLIFRNGVLKFADWNSVGVGNIATFNIQNPAAKNITVWDVTNPLVPIQITTISSAGTNSFNTEVNRLKTFFAFDGTVTETPSYYTSIANQDLHSSTFADYIIVVHPNFLTQANRLANFHKTKFGTTCKVATTEQVYNEFSSGAQDISAIRDFVKMLYDKAGTDETKMPKNLLLFGDASYDYKNRISNNLNFVPTYETDNSSVTTDGYATDDFFGFLDDVEYINSSQYANTLDIGIGRFTVNTEAQAKIAVDKVIHYCSSASFGAWKNNITFCADNRDPGPFGAFHMDDAEAVVQVNKDTSPVYNQYKIYVDAFELYATPNGYRAPQAKQSLDAMIYGGSLVVNYNGHGGYGGWCEERLLYNNDIDNYYNYDKLSFFITATCDFAKYDEPDRLFPGEKLLLSTKGGAIALMSTSNLVYAGQNRVMNTDYFRKGFTPIENSGKMPTFGESYRLSKNLVYKEPLSTISAANHRKFILLGDPQLSLAFPNHSMQLDSLNGKWVKDPSLDTLKSLGSYTLKGRVTNGSGTTLTNFNGFADIIIFDKEKKYNTIPFDGATEVKTYMLQNNSVFKGKVKVQNGSFTVKVIVPKDIDYNFGKAKVSMYAYNDVEDANGFNNDITIGGASTNAISDNTPPEIKLYLNNRSFVNGGTTNANPIFLMDAKDESGINTSGNSPGHDLSFYLDNKPGESIILNNFFESSPDEFGAGSVRYPLSNLTVGNHTITATAWDILNNSSKASLEFTVVDSKDPTINHLYNLPNPFTTNTEFTFEHNQPYQNLYVTLQILSMTGRVVKQFQNVVYADGYRIHGSNAGLTWDGKDQNGDLLGKGVYMYKLTYKTQEGKTASQMQKLLLLR